MGVPGMRWGSKNAVRWAATPNYNHRARDGVQGARLAVGRDPLDAAIGGDALLKAALHQLGVMALLLHLR